MEYILIVILQLLGIGFHVMQKISILGDKFPDKSIREIRILFLKEDLDTLVVSALVLMLNLVSHYIVTIYTTIPKMDNYHLYSFGAALVLGYAGQRVIYKYLGTAERFLDKKIDNKLQ
jgi:hypothetical protein